MLPSVSFTYRYLLISIFISDTILDHYWHLRRVFGVFFLTGARVFVRDAHRKAFFTYAKHAKVITQAKNRQGQDI